MLKEQHQSKKYPKKYFRKPFPPTHNPLIASVQKDTLSNVRDALYTLRELSELSGFMDTKYTASGFHYLMTAIVGALCFEIENR